MSKENYNLVQYIQYLHFQMLRRETSKHCQDQQQGLKINVKLKGQGTSFKGHVRDLIFAHFLPILPIFFISVLQSRARERK